jgi:hypothetical protein
MTNKRREQRRQRHAAVIDQVRWAAVLQAVVLGGAAALIVIGAIVPSEAAVSDGAFAPLAAGWCLLAVVWAASLWLDERPTIHIGWTEAIGAALIGWHSLAAVISLGQTNDRLAINAHWLILCYGLTFLLLRQTLRTTEHARSFAVLMVWLATLLASLGLYQFCYSTPKLQAEFQRDPDKALMENGIPTDPGSPLRVQFENRVKSVEPLATFGLTNSLAGVLAPWLIAIVAVGFANYRELQQRRALFALAISAAIIAACLLLTKSRTAYLATLAGTILVGLYGRRGGWRLDWRIPAALAGAAMVIGLVAVYFGGLDIQVLSEAPKSVLYRLEYWQATARIIAQSPIFGCGPGNFQEVYATYKLPQASETVADPHNFLLEMWATAGTPAIVLLVALLVAFAADVATATRKRQPHEREPEAAPVAPTIWIVFGGAAIGLLIAPLVATGLGYPLDPVSRALSAVPVIWLLGFALLLAAWWSLQSWVASGELTLAAAVIPQVVLLVNLLAAGALVFPAVVTTLLVLAPIALLVAECQLTIVTVLPNAATLPRRIALPRLVVALVTLALAAIAVACLWTEYYPVLNSQLAMTQAMDLLQHGRSRGASAEAATKAVAAAKADALSPEPWRLLAEFNLARWRLTGDEKDWKSFVEVADTFRRLDPRHHVAWSTRGNWFLGAWRKSGRPDDLQEALAAYSEASRHYPNRALYHAQLAWTQHLAGHAELARQEAEIACKLDEQMPHVEQKLDRQHVVDPQMSDQEIKMFREETAEQTARRLRNPALEVQP